MKKLLRKVQVFLLLTLLVFLTACGGKSSSQIDAEARDGIREANLEWVKNYTETQFVPLFLSASYEDFAMYKAQGNAVLFNILFDNDLANRWGYFTEQHGKVTDAKADEVMREGNEYTGRVILTGEDGAQMALTILYDHAGQPVSCKLADYADDSNDTIVDKLQTAGANTITGLLVVFSVLVVLSLIIAAFKLVNKAVEPPTKKGSEAAAVEAAAPVAKVADTAEEDDPQIIAAIAAAVAAMNEASGSSYVVRSIRRKGGNRW